MQKFKARHNQSCDFRNNFKSFFQEKRPESEAESFFTSGKKEKIDCFDVDGFCDLCKAVFGAMEFFYHFCSCQEARSSLTHRDIERGNKKREMNELRRENIKERI